MTVKCIGIGNRIMGDDSIGVKVVEALSTQFKRKNIDVILGETDIDYALSKIEDGDLLFIVDSTYFGTVPGTVTFTRIQQAIGQYQQVYSQHQPSLIHLLNIYKKSVDGYIIGIEVNEIHFSLELSSILIKQFSNICDEVSQFIHHYLKLSHTNCKSIRMEGSTVSKKTIFLENMKNVTDIKTSFMIMKRLYRDSSKFVCILGDRTGDIKATILNEKGKLEIGQVIEVQGKKDAIFEISEFTVIEDYNIEDYLPTVKRPIEEIMSDIEEITKENITSKEGIELNNYFFGNEDFVEKFKKGIAGVSMHHNYIGGLAEHTLNVMYLTKILCDRYECRRTETAILAAKLHDIGKIYELEVNGPFRYSLRGEMEGHIVIGVQMIEDAVKANPDFYSEDFVTRIKACLVQHHGKLEYGSPREMKTEEAFIVNFADSIDATMNKIAQIKENTEENQWSEYDRRIETRLYL